MTTGTRKRKQPSVNSSRDNSAVKKKRKGADGKQTTVAKDEESGDMIA